MSPAWRRELLRFVLLLAGAGLAGWPFDLALPFMLLAAIAYGAWLLYWLYRLERWLTSERRPHPPEARGLWGEVFDALYRFQRRNRQRTLRVARLIRAFRHSTAAMPDGVVALNRDWRIVWFNDAAARLLGLSRQQDGGQHIGNLVRHPAFIEYIEQGLFQGVVEVESPLDDERRLALSVVAYGQGERLLLVRDITRLHRLEQMRREFVANASHELRSPLTVISGYLGMLAQDARIMNEWREPVTAMRRQAGRMETIVADLLELSRLETANDDVVEEDIDVAAMLARIRDESLARGEGPQDITLRIDTPTRLRGVPAEIYSALANLVINAMRYTPEDGAVTVRWFLQQDRPAVSVQDTGIGIPAEHIPRLTERFYRVDNARTRERGGTGLGLAIVKHVLQRHGAQLHVESTVGEGSTFTCVFPAGRAVTKPS